MNYYVSKLSEKGSIAVDDTLLVKGTQAAAGSHILNGFKPLFSAEAVTDWKTRATQYPAKPMSANSA